MDDNFSLGSVGIDCLCNRKSISWDSSYLDTVWISKSLGSVFILSKGVLLSFLSVLNLMLFKGWLWNLLFCLGVLTYSSDLSLLLVAILLRVKSLIILNFDIDPSVSGVLRLGVVLIILLR